MAKQIEKFGVDEKDVKIAPPKENKPKRKAGK